ncbi:MAG: ECF transporter S component, partial [Veillonella sp.]|nr:ECF transporter S component [Veillonella sp.]
TASFTRILSALIIGTIWTAFGYFLAWWFVLESAAVAASKIQYSLITSAAGIVVAIVLTPKLQSVVRRLFTKN